MELQQVTTATFSKEVLEADQPVLVDFWAPSCQPCLALMPAVKELAQRHADDLKVVTVKATARENWQLCIEQRVMGLPLYLLFCDGKLVRRITGEKITEQTLADSIDELVQKIA